MKSDMKAFLSGRRNSKNVIESFIKRIQHFCESIL